MKQTLYKTMMVAALSLIGVSGAGACMHLTEKGMEDAWGRCMRQESAQRNMQQSLEDLQRQQQQMLQLQQQQTEQLQRQQYLYRQQQQQQQQQQRTKTCVRLADGSPMCFD